MARQSAGILLYRFREGRPEFFLVHPGGPFWTGKEEGAWSIPKGEFTTGEEALAAATREFSEETGQQVHGPFMTLTPIKQKSGKMVYAFACEGDIDPDKISSNSFSQEWPYKSGNWQSFPEVDKAGWFAADEAMRMINASQAALVAELLERLKK